MGKNYSFWQEVPIVSWECRTKEEHLKQRIRRMCERSAEWDSLPIELFEIFAKELFEVLVRDFSWDVKAEETVGGEKI